MKKRLTVLSVDEDVTIDKIGRRYYVDDNNNGTALGGSYLVHSAMRVDGPLAAILDDLRHQNEGPDFNPFIYVDIVGHACLDRDGVPTGLLMDGDTTNPSVSLGDRGALTGAACLQALMQYTAPGVKFRLVLCDGSELPEELIDEIWATLVAVNPDCSLWTSTDALDINDFGIGGLTAEGEKMLKQVRSSAAS